MSDVQWLWFYMNLLKDAKEEADGTREKLDYLAWFINPEQMQRVSERRRWEESAKAGQAKGPHREVVGDQEVVYHETRVNDAFEQELAKAMGDEQATQLPEEHFKGNPAETKDEFIARALAAQGDVRVFNERVVAEAEHSQLADEARRVAAEAVEAGVDPADVDFVEVSVTKTDGHRRR